MNTIAPAFEDAEKGSSLWHDAWLRLRKNQLALFGGSVLLFMIVVALLTPWIAPYSYEAQNLDLGASSPSAAHWLGTDIFGRDVLTQIMYGGRISLAVGFIATAVALLIGVTWGAVAGYVGGRVDAVMMRLVDILYALPFMIFIVLLMVVFGRNILLLFLAIGAVEWLTMALINEPKLLIADEPTTALDVTIQAQILKLIAELQTKRDIGVLFISHDLAVVSDIADQIVVMEKGKVVESGQPKAIFDNPQHPYTQKLLAAIPSGQKTAETVTPDPLIRIENLRTWFTPTGGAGPVKAVEDVSLEIHRGEVLGLVGESGSGKSTLGRSILRLVPITDGQITFEGTELSSLEGRSLKQFRHRMQMIFQDPYASLNPRMTVYDTLAEPLLLHGLVRKADLDQAIRELMDNVGLARAFVRKYPHEFSGGQRQRIAIGRALATRPEFIVADEPVSALDVTIQAQILDLLADLTREYGLTMLFISHDLAVIRQIADRIAVMYHGKLVEEGSTAQVFEMPQQDYTRSLLAAIPGANAAA